VRLEDGRILVQSVDFFTPIVDDPYQFGQIAAANALSDIYAMGARPLFALNIVAFPSQELPLEVLAEILRGGMDKAHEAGIHIVGGHTIDDTEPKYGLVVTGEVAEEDLIRNDGAKVGDWLVLTKPLGTGIIATAIKRGTAPNDVVVRAVEIMTILNRDAAQAALEVGVHAMTDVTGFGLLGHLLELCTASKAQAVVDVAALPLLPGVRDLATDGAIPGGTRRNLDHARKALTLEGDVSELDQVLAADAQTSGGLLIAVSPEQVDELVARLTAKGTPAAAVIGKITGKGPARITLRGG
jgi:selenide,water dikinase